MGWWCPAPEPGKARSDIRASTGTRRTRPGSSSSGTGTMTPAPDGSSPATRPRTEGTGTGSAATTRLVSQIRVGFIQGTEAAIHFRWVWQYGSVGSRPPFNACSVLCSARVSWRLRGKSLKCRLTSPTMRPNSSRLLFQLLQREVSGNGPVAGIVRHQWVYDRLPTGWEREVSSKGQELVRYGLAGSRKVDLVSPAGLHFVLEFGAARGYTLKKLSEIASQTGRVSIVIRP